MLLLVLLIIALVTALFIRSNTYFGTQRYYLEQTIEELGVNIHFGYKTIETEHFIVKYLPTAQNKAHLVANEAENIYGPITHIFRTQVPRKTMIVLKEYEQDKLYQLMTGYNFQGVIYIYDDPYDRLPVSITLPHEFSHVMLRYKYDGAYLIPPWLDEGLAVNIETSITGNKRKIADDWDEGKIYSINDLGKIRSFTELNRDVNTIYHQSAGIVGYIVETYGEEALFRLLEQIIYNRKPFTESVHDILHTDVSTLSQNSQQYFRESFFIRGAFKVHNTTLF